MDNKIGIVIHPIDRELLYDYEPGMKRFDAPTTQKILEWMSPFKAANIEGIKSKATHETLNAELIMCPLLIEQMASKSPRKVFNKVAKTVRFAEKSGCRIIALVAYTALVGERGMKLQELVKTPLTTGNHLTLAVMPETILRAIKLLNYKSQRLNMLLLGANPLIYILVHHLGHHLHQSCLYYASQDKIKAYHSLLSAALKKRVKILPRDPAGAMRDADIIVNATSRLPASFDERLLKSGAIVFDASYPRRIQITRKDILLIDGITMRPPGRPKFNFNFGLPDGLCFPCMAEPMVLAFENKYESYSLGKDISYDKSESIFHMAKKHGFSLGPLTSYEKIIPEEKFADVIKHIKPKKKVFSFLLTK